MHPNEIHLKEIPSWFCKATINKPMCFTFNRVVDTLKGAVHYVICTFPRVNLNNNINLYLVSMEAIMFLVIDIFVDFKLLRNLF